MSRFISLIRYKVAELKHISTKFINKSQMNLTVTVDYMKNGVKKLIYANFDAINTKILGKNGDFIGVDADFFSTIDWIFLTK